MKRLARVFSLLALLVLVGAAVLIWWPAPQIAPIPPALTGQVDRIVVEKAARRMTVYRQGVALKTYQIALGFAPTGTKQQQGDGKTPEGIFHIDRRNENSAYHLSLGLNYPRPQDRARAAQAGVDPGGDIFFHGQPNALPASMTLPHDWTAGCIALSNAEITELWAAVPIGTEVEIRP